MKKTCLFLLLLAMIRLSCYGATFSFAVFGDNRDGDEIFMDIIKRVNSDKDIKFALNTGDLTPHGSSAQYENYWKMTASCEVRIYDAIGNHDLGLFNTGTGIFRKKYGETYYYFDHEDSRFVIIDDTRAKGLGRKQWNWLKEALKTDKKIFVCLHKPLFDPTGMYPNYGMKPDSECRALNKLLISNRVKYIFAGHIHGYGREVADGVTYVIAGAAGAPLYLPAFNGGYFSYVKVTVDGDNIKDEVVKVYNEE